MLELSIVFVFILNFSVQKADETIQRLKKELNRSNDEVKQLQKVLRFVKFFVDSVKHFRLIS